MTLHVGAVAFPAYPFFTGTAPRRINKALTPRCHAVGIFPDDAAVIRLVGAVLLETHDEWQTPDRAYFSEESMAQLAAISDDDPAKEVTTDTQHQLPAA